jgi:hypothetical protein
MNQRRSLNEALQTNRHQAEAFLSAGNPAPATNVAATAPPQPPPTLAEAPKLAKDSAVEVEVAGFDGSLVSLSVRVPRSLPSRLLRASVDRKLRRARPCTQQEIVTEALTLWLNTHGYSTFDKEAP